MVDDRRPGSQGAAQLRQRDHRDLQLLGQRLQSARDGGDFLRPVLNRLPPMGTADMSLQVVHDQQVEAFGLPQPARLGPHLADGNAR